MTDGTPQVMTPLPKYKCHKEVYAIKITAIELDSDLAQKENRETDGGALIQHDYERVQPIKVDHAYMSKHKPTVGGYYVVYEDGYKSFSPAEAFEGGYTKIE